MVDKQKIEEIRERLKISKIGHDPTQDTMVRWYVHDVECLLLRLAEANLRADAAIKEMKLIVDVVREKHCDDTCCFACMFNCDTSITDTGGYAEECPGFELNDCFLWRGAEKGDEHE